MSDNHAAKRSKKSGRRYKDGVLLRVSDIERECDRLRRRPRAALYPLLPITEPLKGKGVAAPRAGSKPHHRKHCRKRKPRRLRVRRGWQAVAPLQHHHHHHHYQPRTGAGVCHHDPLLIGRGALAVASMQELRWPAPALGRRRRCRDVEAGGGGGEDDRERRSRRIVSVIVASVASFILMMCVALVAVTLRLTPAIDEMVRKGNEEIYRSMSAGASTPAPSTEGATNHTTPPSG